MVFVYRIIIFVSLKQLAILLVHANDDTNVSCSRRTQRFYVSVRTRVVIAFGRSANESRDTLVVLRLGSHIIIIFYY